MKRILYLLPILAVLAACHHPAESKYKGYSTKDGITYYKYSYFDSVAATAHAGDVMEVHLSYSKMNDSLFWDSHDHGYPYTVFLPYDTMKAGGSYMKILLNGNAGDSINFIVPAKDVFRQILHLAVPYFLHANDMMKVNARIVGLMNPDQYADRQKKIKEFSKDLDIQEQLDLLQYVTIHNIPQTAKQDDVYFIPEEEGTGPAVKDGSLLSIAYSGRFLNGHLFDSVSTAKPFQFKLGDTAQVIAGIEIGIKRMREGGKAKIIIPSQLAFGDYGSSTGIVPPYTSVIYEVTMLKVNDPGK
jgi:peptidylprolyl isomerase